MPFVSVVIVEDETDLLILFRTVIRRIIPAEQILTANGGEAALHILQEQTPTLVILDLAMPHVSGNDVIHYIISQPRLDATKIMVVTAVPMRLSADNQARASIVLVKPVTSQALMSAVHELLNLPFSLPDV